MLGNPQAAYELGAYYYETKNYLLAVRWLYEADKSGALYRSSFERGTRYGCLFYLIVAISKCTEEIPNLEEILKFIRRKTWEDARSFAHVCGADDISAAWDSPLIDYYLNLTIDFRWSRFFDHLQRNPNLIQKWLDDEELHQKFGLGYLDWFKSFPPHLESPPIPILRALIERTSSHIQTLLRNKQPSETNFSKEMEFLKELKKFCKRIPITVTDKEDLLGRIAIARALPLINKNPPDFLEAIYLLRTTKISSAALGKLLYRSPEWRFPILKEWNDSNPDHAWKECYLLIAALLSANESLDREALLILQNVLDSLESGFPISSDLDLQELTELKDRCRDYLQGFPDLVKLFYGLLHHDRMEHFFYFYSMKTLLSELPSAPQRSQFLLQLSALVEQPFGPCKTFGPSLFNKEALQALHRFIKGCAKVQRGNLASVNSLREQLNGTPLSLLWKGRRPDLLAHFNAYAQGLLEGSAAEPASLTLIETRSTSIPSAIPSASPPEVLSPFLARYIHIEEVGVADLAPAHPPLSLPSSNAAAQAQTYNTLEEVRRAAGQGSADAQNRLGECYLKGSDGMEVDVKEAIKWLLPAAEKGHAVACYNLALCYRCVGSYDYLEGYRWLRRASWRGIPEAKIREYLHTNPASTADANYYSMTTFLPIDWDSLIKFFISWDYQISDRKLAEHCTRGFLETLKRYGLSQIKPNSLKFLLNTLIDSINRITDSTRFFLEGISLIDKEIEFLLDAKEHFMKVGYASTYYLTLAKPFIVLGDHLQALRYLKPMVQELAPLSNYYKDYTHFTAVNVPLAKMLFRIQEWSFPLLHLGGPIDPATEWKERYLIIIQLLFTLDHFIHDEESQKILMSALDSLDQASANPTARKSAMKFNENLLRKDSKAETLEKVQALKQRCERHLQGKPNLVKAFYDLLLRESAENYFQYYAMKYSLEEALHAPRAGSPPRSLANLELLSALVEQQLGPCKSFQPTLLSAEAVQALGRLVNICIQINASDNPATLYNRLKRSLNEPLLQAWIQEMPGFSSNLAAYVGL